MGMVVNKVEVMLLTQDGKKLYWGMELDNEISTTLTNNKNLFDSATSVNAFAECIGKGFMDEYMDDEYVTDPNFIKQYCDDFSPYYGDTFASLKKLINQYAGKESCKTAFVKVVLLSNNAFDGSREYKYNVFDLEKNTMQEGQTHAAISGTYYSPIYTPESKDFMESLL